MASLSSIYSKRFIHSSIRVLPPMVHMAPPPVPVQAPAPAPVQAPALSFPTLTAPPLTQTPADEWAYSAFIKEAFQGKVRSIYADRGANKALIEDASGLLHAVWLPDDFSLSILLDKNIDIYIRPDTKPVKWGETLMNAFNILFQMVILGVILQAMFLASKSSGGSSFLAGGSEIHDASATQADSGVPSMLFKDVAGLQVPKQELAEIVDYLKYPEKYAALGAELPKGILLYGPPGTGKTLLAKAVAGEAKVPFFFASGSEFVQIFVGIGASRVRDLFKKAREKAPCIVFIDEIDAIGRARSTNLQAGSNSEQEQTMNQILTEMDGFKPSSGILVIAATNRMEVLDDALIRSGRFDRHIQIQLPTKSERQAILAVHTRNAPLHPDVSLTSLAAQTQGLSGADLKNLVNEAKLFAIRQDASQLTQEAFENSLDKMVLGTENPGVSLTPEQADLIAYHEAGHALLGILVSDYDLLQRATIVPRGDAGGLTVFQEKEQDIALHTQQYLLNRLIVALGGRVAEQCVYGNLNVSTGAGADLETVQRIARSMITHYGFNETLGQVSWSSEFPISGGTADSIDQEVKYLVDWAYREATQLIQSQEFYLHRIAEALVQHKTLYYNDLMETIQGITCELPLRPSRPASSALLPPPPAFYLPEPQSPPPGPEGEPGSPYF
jgi:cell division protease FtsH